MPFTTLTATVAVLPEANIDTDIILPARFLLLTEKAGLGRYAFADRHGLALAPGAQILVAGDNFGCGSSREQAAWALADLGFRCIIAPGFGEIFAANCARNGLLAVVLADVDWRCVLAERVLTVNLTTQTIRLADGAEIGFAIDPVARNALLNGWDEIGLVLAKDSDAIAVFETAQRTTQPWLWDGETNHG